MPTLIRKIADYLVSNWKSLHGSVRWTLEQIASSAIVEAVIRGFNTTVAFLKTVSENVLDKIASVLGI